VRKKKETRVKKRITKWPSGRICGLWLNPSQNWSRKKRESRQKVSFKLREKKRGERNGNGIEKRRRTKEMKVGSTPHSRNQQ